VLTTDRLRKKVLGIALGERGLHVAEVACAPTAGARVARAAEFVYPAGLSLEQPEALGVALAAFLNERGFETRRAVVGLPARWLLLKQHALPPADPDAAAAMLWLRAESETVPELGELVFDFSGQPRPDRPASVLLMGLPRRWLDRLAVMAKSAGFQTAAVTPAAVALATISAARLGSPCTLLLGSEAAELCVHEAAQTRILRHLGSNSAPPALLGELRRAAVTHTLEGLTPAAGDVAHPPRTARELVVWDDGTLDDAGLAAIGDATGLPVTRGEIAKLLGAPAGAHPANAEHPDAAAVALALTARPDVNLLRPRVAPPRGQGVSRRTAWMSGAAAVVAIVALLAILDLTRMQRQLTRVDENLKLLEPSLKTAKPFVQNMQFVETFAGAHPRYLACLRDVTLAIAPDAKTYLTNFHLKANMKGEVSGHAATSQDLLNLTDQLNASGHFTDLKRKLEAGGKSGDVAFSVTFTYSPH
jgi:hypothetical protein